MIVKTATSQEQDVKSPQRLAATMQDVAEVFVARQPIMDAGGRVKAYERLCQLGGCRLLVNLKSSYPNQIIFSTAPVIVQPCHVAKRSLRTAR